jgi:F420-0:gamma-glutamyl ligase
MGVILPGCDIVDTVYDSLSQLDKDRLLDHGDVICVTESVVARAQNNFASVQDVALQVRKKLGIGPGDRIGVVFPILSRNRFSLILKAIAAAVPQGEVILQLSYPTDEVGNQLIPEDYSESAGKCYGDVITKDEAQALNFRHPITGVDYIQLYSDIIEGEQARAEIFLCNDPMRIAQFEVAGVIVADVHRRYKTKAKLSQVVANCITLQDLCNTGTSWSEWGLLGSNLSAGDKLKLPPRQADQVAEAIQERVAVGLKKNVEVIIYGDGAYQDPSTGIYELADPMPAFGATPKLRGAYREGFKYKYLVDKYHANGQNPAEIEASLKAKKGEEFARDSIETEGTTPRRVEDIIASLADLISGSADAGTPLVICKDFLGSTRRRD